jgi:tryptophanyl-tRNA synthetase
MTPPDSKGAAASASAAAELASDRTSRVLTGYRPTGPLHVGHWLGNIQNMLRLQADHDDVFFFIADWHMLTTHSERTAELPGFIRELVLDWLAAGLDPEKATIYRQSDIPEVAEMALLLGMRGHVRPHAVIGQSELNV